MLVTATAFCAEKKLKLIFPETTVQMIALFYPNLGGKTVVLDNRELGSVPISVDAGETTLTSTQALRFVEAALYLKGIEVIPKGDTEVVFSRFAVIAPHPERRRIINETK